MQTETGKFPKNAWYVAAWGTELTEPPLARTLLCEPIVLFRQSDGKAIALSDRCPHRGLPLSLGVVTQQGLQCGYHGIVFGEDGKCVEIPGQDSIPKSMCVRSYPLHEIDGLVWIWMGQQEPDLSLIPRFPYYTDPAWPNKPHVQRIRCHYQLIIDNLLDQTHLPYIHKGTIGGQPQSQAKAEFSVQATERGMHFMRWVRGYPPPPIYVEADIGFKPDDIVERWAEFEYFAPGTVTQYTGGLTADRGAYEHGNREGGFVLRIMHNITPETEDSCFYFWAGCHGFRHDEPGVTEWVSQSLASTFKEDESVLEAQHARNKELPGVLHSTRHDQARVMADRALKRLLAQEYRG